MGLSYFQPVPLRHQFIQSQASWYSRWELDICWKPVFLAGLTKGAGGDHLQTLKHFQNNEILKMMIVMRQHGKLFFFFFFFFFWGEGWGIIRFLYWSIIIFLWRDRLIFFTGNKHLDNMANCPAKAAYGFMDLDTRTAKWDSFVFYWLVIICLMIGWFSLWTLHGSRTKSGLQAEKLPKLKPHLMIIDQILQHI